MTQDECRLVAIEAWLGKIAGVVHRLTFTMDSPLGNQSYRRTLQALRHDLDTAYEEFRNARS